MGNYDLAEFITSQSNKIYRVTHANDWVPHTPFTFLKYSHPSPEYWVDQESGVAVETSVVKLVVGIDSKEGNTGTDFDNSNDDAHNWYFGDIGSTKVCAVAADAED